jgi:hypothetical protein
MPLFDNPFTVLCCAPFPFCLDVRHLVTWGTLYLKAASKFSVGDCNAIYYVSLPKKLNSLCGYDLVLVW